jgi:Uma2 family endonuclease
MTALLETPAVRDHVYRLSLEEYHGLHSENVELLRGIVVTKMPKSPVHNFVTQKLMYPLLEQTPKEFQVRVEQPLTLPDSEPEPDISIVRGRPEEWLEENPSTAHLVIEVSVSSIAIDERKAEIYAEAGIPEYWLLRPEDRAADVYRQPTPQGYLAKGTVFEGETLHCASIPQIQIPLSAILPPKQG